MNQKDDFTRRPFEDAQTCATNKKKSLNPLVKDLYDLNDAQKLRRDKSKYDHALYVKYLTPLDQVQELKAFFDK